MKNVLEFTIILKQLCVGEVVKFANDEAVCLQKQSVQISKLYICSQLLMVKVWNIQLSKPIF